MTEIIFKTIPRYLFEPYAIVAFFAFFLFLAVWRIKRNYLFWVITLSVCFMMLWRVCILIVSSRYSAALIYPVLILSGYACFKIDVFLEKIPQISPRIRRIIPYFLLAILFFVSLGKIFHLNPYRSSYLELYTMIKEDARKFPEKILLCDDYNAAKRAQYYVSADAFSCPELDFPKHRFDKNTFQKVLLDYSFISPVVYFFLDLSSSSQEITPKELSLQPKEWKLLARKYLNRHKKREIFVYRYTPERKLETKIRLLQNGSDTKIKSQLLNGDFENFYSPGSRELTEMKKAFKDMNIELISKDKIFFPVSWGPIWTPSFLPNTKVAISLSSEQALTGKYSLLIKTDSPVGLVHTLQKQKADYKLQFLVRAKRKTVFSWGVYLYDEHGTHQRTRQLKRLTFIPNQIHQVEIIIPENAFTPYSTFLIFFQLEHGELLLDNVSLEKIEAAK